MSASWDFLYRLATVPSIRRGKNSKRHAVFRCVYGSFADVRRFPRRAYASWGGDTGMAALRVRRMGKRNDSVDIFLSIIVLPAWPHAQDATEQDFFYVSDSNEDGVRNLAVFFIRPVRSVSFCCIGVPHAGNMHGKDIIRLTGPQSYAITLDNVV